MASPAQMAANRRNAQRSTGPRTEEGKKAVRLNAVKHGMTAKVIVLAHESAVDYHEIRATLIEDYAPATSKELMLVDQIAAGYWRTIRARRFETALFDEQIVAKKRYHRKDLAPNAGQDDRVAAAVLQEIEPKELDNYFRYDGTISRDYYRAINTLEKMQAARRREEDRQERKREKAARELDRILKRPDPDTIAERSPEPPPARHPAETLAMASKAIAITPVNSIGFVSSQSPDRIHVGYRDAQTAAQNNQSGPRLSHSDGLL
jgi:hypothetical protein